MTLVNGRSRHEIDFKRFRSIEAYADAGGLAYLERSNMICSFS